MDAIANMKINIIEDFTAYVRALNIGYVNDYSYILHKISFVQTYSSLDKIDPTYEFLINK